jgi:hypothetical protein
MMYMMIGGSVLVIAVYVAAFAFCRAAARVDAALDQPAPQPTPVPTPNAAVPVRWECYTSLAPSEPTWAAPHVDALHIGEVADVF